MDGDRYREVANGQESVSLFNQRVQLVLSCQPAAHTRPDVDLDLRSEALSVFPRDACETSTSIF
jgi:hypothetical protein